MALTRVRACTFKRPFLNAEEAGSKVKEIKKAGRMRNFPLIMAYKCPYCEYWHVGHSTRRAR